LEDAVMGEDYANIKNNLVIIASELHRFKGVFSKAISKLDIDEQNKYASQFQWFSKKVTKALDDAGIRIVTLDGQLYDPGMAVTPLNIEDFDAEDILYVAQTMEPIIMQENVVVKTGTVILGRVEK
jgi:uncharacterized Rmd1/YagE family protein